jgi:hypothetical protein
MLRVAAYSLVCLLLFGVGAPLQAAVVVQHDASSLTLSNGKVVLKFTKPKPWFSITAAALRRAVQRLISSDSSFIGDLPSG